MSSNYLSRPTNIDDFIQRLASDGTSPEEMKALQAISEKMIRIFTDNPANTEFASDIAKLSSITRHKDYRDILRAFGNAITQGTADGTNINPTILWHFLSVIRRADETRSPKDARLGSVLASLERRLEAARRQADLELQCQLIRTLSAVLDAMVDIGVSGLSREYMREPLLRQLKDLAKHKEPRLAQAAGYAYQALLNVPDDETPGKAAWRHFCEAGNGVLNTAGAVSTMDPGKLVDAIPSLMAIPDLMNDLKDAYESLKLIYEGGQHTHKSKKWYFDLRYTAAFIGIEDFPRLKIFAECCQEEEFLCGLYAQLEVQALSSKKEPIRRQSVDLIYELLIKPASKSQHVQAWGKLVAKTLHRPDWSQSVKPSHTFLRRKKKVKVYELENPFLEEPNLTSLSSLLGEAWSKCEKAKMYYAVVALSTYYAKSGRLKIERISGDTLPMERCYINLAFVQQSNRENTINQNYPLSPSARRKAAEVDKTSQVTLQLLFKARKLSDGTINTPKRILIRGVAGVGKTTLCKKIVYEYTYRNMWQHLYDCILWVPLRRLKLASASDPESLLCEIFFHGYQEKRALADTLWKSINGSGTNVRVLFLLDGLDEVSKELSSSSESRAKPLLEQLLQQPNVIITSRPYGINQDSLEHIDLELETTGFNPQQVAAYIGTTEIVPDKKISKDMQLFIKSNSLIQGLFQIPIQLDALCYSWNKGLYLKDVPKTMTAIYESIVRKLCQKDMVLLKKKDDNGDLLNRHDAQDIKNRSQIEYIMRPELEFLEQLAFTGLYNNIFEFNAEYRDRIYRFLEEQNVVLPLLYENALKHLSFLRTSDKTMQDSEQVYHFLHLTYQEFFAASYFAKCWTNDRDLSCLGFEALQQPLAIKPVEFLRNEKYNPRYSILWRFVAGLIYTDSIRQTSNSEGILGFFKELQAEPRDLLGIAHQRIAMNTLFEVTLPDPKTSIQRDIENELLFWFLLEDKLGRDFSQLGHQSEFPEHILKIALLQEDEEKKIYTLSTFSRRPGISPDILDTALSWLNPFSPSELKLSIIRMLAHHCQFLSNKGIKALISCLKDVEHQVRSTTAETLGNQSDLPQSILDNLVLCLKDKEWSVIYAAAQALGSQSDLPQSILDNLVLCLKDKESSVIYAAAKALGSQSDLPQSILDNLVLCLKDEEWDVRSAAAEVLGRQPHLPQSILNNLVLHLKDEELSVRLITAQALGRQPDLPQSILDNLVLCLKDQNCRVRSTAAEALGRQLDLPQSTLDNLVLCLKDEESSVRSAAAWVFRSQSDLPQSILDNLVLCLKDEQRNVRSAAAKALGMQSDLPQSIFDNLVLCLKHEESSVRSAAAQAFRNQSDLSQSILDNLVLCLKDEQRNVRSAAAQALGNQSDLPQSILDNLVLCLKDKESSVIYAAAKALGSQSDLPQSILDNLVLCLKDEESSVRSAAAWAFRNQSDLPQSIIKDLTISLSNILEQFWNQITMILNKHKVCFLLSCSEISQLKILYRSWLKESPREQLSCYIKDEYIFIVSADGTHKLVLGVEQREKFKRAIREVRVELGFGDEMLGVGFVSNVQE